MLLLLLLPSLLCIFFSPFSSAAQLCHPDDVSALLAFKNSFSNPSALPSWDPQFHCCNWYGVLCNETTSIVTGLDIASVDLKGTIPPSISKLKNLTSLSLYKIPNLAGKIPPQIGQLPFLGYLLISSTNISGPVPHFLAHLTNLYLLDLSSNRLSGSIPPSLATLPSTYSIDLSRNHLTGPIPDLFSHYPKEAGFPVLRLSHNMLSGKLPPSFANVNFNQIDVSSNSLSGDASLFFGNRVTRTLVISRNKFEFDFSKVRFREELAELDISHNNIYGSIPPRITKAVRLQSLNVSYNRLCGKIPTGWKLREGSESLVNTSFIHNKCLCGIPLDPCK
ncbi:hypothetical protein ACS0TY_019895 [Phlomoides rotata]